MGMLQPHDSSDGAADIRICLPNEYVGSSTGAELSCYVSAERARQSVISRWHPGWSSLVLPDWTTSSKYIRFLSITLPPLPKLWGGDGVGGPFSTWL